MAGEARQILPVDFDLEAHLQRQREAAAPPDAVKEPTVEERQAADAVFAQKTKENEQVANLVNLWAGAVLLHGLAIDARRKPAHAEDDETKIKEVDDKQADLS